MFVVLAEQLFDPVRIEMATHLAGGVCVDLFGFFLLPIVSGLMRNLPQDFQTQGGANRNDKIMLLTL
jgi:hypothetical protein